MKGGTATIDSLAPQLNARIEAFEELLADRFAVGGHVSFETPDVHGAKLIGLRWHKGNGGWGLDAIYAEPADRAPLSNATLADRAAATFAFDALWHALEDNEARRVSDVKQAIARVDDLLAEKRGSR